MARATSTRASAKAWLPDHRLAQRIRASDVRAARKLGERRAPGGPGPARGPRSPPPPAGFGAPPPPPRPPPGPPPPPPPAPAPPPPRRPRRQPIHVVPP